MARQDEFRRRHPDWSHRDVPFGSVPTDRLVDAWRTVLDSQNGRDVDDILSGGMTHFLRSVGLTSPGRLLILGCGTGEEVREAEALGWKVEGVTLGPMNVACAAEQGITVHFEDFHVSSFPTASFDAVVGRQVWEHSWSPFLFAIECARVLRPGGRLALETPCCAEYVYDSATIHHVFCPTPFQGARLLEKAGFVDVQALDGSHGPPCAFEDGREHRDDVGGGNVTFLGTRWGASDASRLSELVRRMTGGHVVRDARSSAISALYQEILGRDPDEAGLVHYKASGLSIEQIRAALSSSTEARLRRKAG